MSNVGRNHLYLHKCEDTYYILQNKPLRIYEDSFGAKILRDNCTHRRAKKYIKGKKRFILLFSFFCRSITSLASSTASSDKKPSRPKSFSIHRLFKKQPKEHCKENCNCDECATKILSKTVSELPKIKCSFVSAPATPINHHIARYNTSHYTMG